MFKVVGQPPVEVPAFLWLFGGRFDVLRTAELPQPPARAALVRCASPRAPRPPRPPDFRTKAARRSLRSAVGG